MARKPNTPPSERHHLVSIEEYDWSSSLLVPSCLLSALDDLLSQCVLVRKGYLSGGPSTLSVKGPAAFSSNMAHPEKYAVLNEDEVEAYTNWHNATHELTPCKGRLFLSPEEWRAQGNSVTKEEE